MFPQVLATVDGSGTRLYPLTLDQPKPLVELCDTAIIANLFRVLASQGCRRFILESKIAIEQCPMTICLSLGGASGKNFQDLTMKYNAGNYSLAILHAGSWWKDD
jgi:hypothetical protein